MIYFLVFLFLEIATTSFFGGMFGFFLTFVWMIASIIIGIFILKNFNLVVMYNINEIMQGNLSKEEFYKNNIAKLLGALLLIIPGFFTDILGIIFFSGLLNSVFMSMFKKKFNKHNNTKKNKKQNDIYEEYSVDGFYTNGQNHKQTKNKTNDTIIDVEVIEPLENKKRK